jgi:LytS/YehU family sensor histidine kinase
MIFLNYLRAKLKLIACLVGGGALMTFFVCDSCLESWNRYILITLFVSAIWVTMWLGNEYISHRLDERLSWTKKPLMRLAIGVLAAVLYSASVGYAIVILFESGFGLNVGGIYQLYVTVAITILITVIMTSRSFLFKWRDSAIDAEKLQKENIAAKYENLKSQVNPHFLFNSLNALTNLVYEDQDKAVKFIKQLSEVYRYVLDTREAEVVSLGEELKFLQSYVYLQQIRFGDKLKIHIRLDNENFFVTPLALQMLVENAIKHNVISEDDPLNIQLYNDDGFIVVENNLQKKSLPGERSSGLGLENIRKRYELLSERSVVIIENENSFVVKLPVLKPKQL